jgi:hypothetical protein
VTLMAALDQHIHLTQEPNFPSRAAQMMDDPMTLPPEAGAADLSRDYTDRLIQRA